MTRLRRGDLALLLGDALRDERVVLCLLLLLALEAAALEGAQVAAALETLGGDEALDLGSATSVSECEGSKKKERRVWVGEWVGKRGRTARRVGGSG